MQTPVVGNRDLCTAGAIVLLVLAAVGPASAAETVTLPAVENWDVHDAQVTRGGNVVTLTVPENYKIGRAVSPTVPAAEEELLTFAMEVGTEYKYASQTFYRAWLELEFVKGTRAMGKAVASPEIIGSQDSTLLAVTGQAPKGATGARVAVCAQNKLWSVMANTARLERPQLLRLKHGGKRGQLVLQTTVSLSSTSGPRTARIAVAGDWPDGTAVALTTSRGAMDRIVLVKGGRAEVGLAYGAGEVGAAEITAGVGDQMAHLRVPDPRAATLEITELLADGHPTPVLVQLRPEGGKMIEGRWQASMPGLFVTPPWQIDLAPGKWELSVRRGPEFHVLTRALEARSGETLSLRKLKLERNVNLRELGWYGGDADGDVYHGERIYTDVSARTASDIARAMGLDWAGVGAWGTPNPKNWGEARSAMRELSAPNFLFMWTDEKPKGRDGHACFVGLTRPDAEPFGWGWTHAVRPLRNHEVLKLIRDSGGATFLNHPLRWWMSSGKFSTNLYATLPFDVCAAGLVDGYNVNEKPKDILVWSMLLDHGYRLAATTGTDFGLDRPVGPVPGKARLYCLCPEGLTGNGLAQAIRRGNTVVSLGPLLLADVDGKPPGTTLAKGGTYAVRARAWPRADEADPIQRLELWSHGNAIETLVVDTVERPSAGGPLNHVFQWQPQGEWDWVAVRVISKRGWALTSAFYAGTSPAKGGSGEPIACRIAVNVAGLNEAERGAAVVEIWDSQPGLSGARKLEEKPLNAMAKSWSVPVTATVVVRTADGRRKVVALYDAIGIPEVTERILQGTEGESPLTTWATYEEVLRLCEQAQVNVVF